MDVLLVVRSGEGRVYFHGPGILQETIQMSLPKCKVTETIEHIFLNLCREKNVWLYINAIDLPSMSQSHVDHKSDWTCWDGKRLRRRLNEFHQ